MPVLSALPAGKLTASAVDSYDALVIVAPAPLTPFALELSPHAGAGAQLALDVDASLSRPRPKAPVVVFARGVPGDRLVLAPTSALSEDIDDPRAIAEAVAAAVNRAVEAGARKPLLHIAQPSSPSFARSREVAALAALGTAWSALEAREAGTEPPAVSEVGVVGLDPSRVADLQALDAGRALCRDITGTEPERMAPLRVAELCEAAFAGTEVEVTVERDVSRYPLLAAVARASCVVERHRPCVVTLDYKPAGEIKRTVVLAGKGVTYDTGGADLKTDGHMAGMSRDKGGAGSVAGLLRAVAAMKLPNVRVIGLLGLVRNSIGEESFVSDEIIPSRAGIRVRIGNTDAEGRLVLADLVARAKELLADAPDPLVLSLATLTGHVYRAHGPYTGIIGNLSARKRGVIDALDATGELWAEPVERSRPRREDYAIVAPRTPAEDVVSANRLASVNTPRGHQFPFAFIDIAAGLRGGSLPFVHVDLAGTAMENADWQFGRPTGVPIATLAAYLAGENAR